MICYEIFRDDVEQLRRCPLCSGTQLREVSAVWHRNGPIFLATAMCIHCRFVFRHYRPTKEWFSRAFAQRERLQALQGINALNPDIEKERYGRYLQLGRMLAQMHSPKDGPAMVLDIGCGPGTGLMAFQDVGFIATGVDEDNTRARYGIGLGLNIAVTPWESFIPTARYDFITCLHSIEHFHFPQGLLERLRDWMKPKGKLVIEVPNLRHFVTDWTDALYLAHIANYSPRALGRLGENSGLVVDKRLRYYDQPTRNDENLCIAFALEKGDTEPSIETTAEDEPGWDWLTATYLSGLDSGAVPPYIFEVPMINDISLTYKNNAKISANLRENLHMRIARMDRSSGRHIVS